MNHCTRVKRFLYTILLVFNHFQETEKNKDTAAMLVYVKSHQDGGYDYDDSYFC